MLLDISDVVLASSAFTSFQKAEDSKNKKVRSFQFQNVTRHSVSQAILRNIKNPYIREIFKK